MATESFVSHENCTYPAIVCLSAIMTNKNASLYLTATFIYLYKTITMLLMSGKELPCFKSGIYGYTL